MQSPARYFRLLWAFARFGLSREMTFRGNYIVKVLVEILWLSILLTFYATVFSQTNVVAGWSRDEYLFFVGCYFTLEGVMESLFMVNCSEFAELIRSGDLDFYLLQPIDEQFLVSCRYVEWSSVPSILMGVGVMAVAISRLPGPIDFAHAALFGLLMMCGVALCYSFMLLLTSSSVWLVRNQSLYELWWLVTSLIRYPREVFRAWWFEPFTMIFTFVLPVMLVVNVPAHLMVKAFEPRMAAYMLLATLVMLYASRRFFRFALQRYRSASS